MPTSEFLVVAFLGLTFIYAVVIWGICALASRDRSQLLEVIARERAAAARRESELLDRILEKEVLKRYAEGVPVPESVLTRPEPTNGSTSFTGPMNEETEALIGQMRDFGMSEEQITVELNKAQRR